MIPAGTYILRPFVESDAASFVAAVQESAATVGKQMPWAHANYCESDALSWFADCEEQRSRGSSHQFGIFHADSGVFVGGCGLNYFNVDHRFCNLGYWVRESWQRRGAASAAIPALLRLAFEELGQGRVEIVVAVGNEPSLRLAAKVGATRECLARNRLTVHGGFVDAYVHSIVPAGRGANAA